MVREAVRTRETKETRVRVRLILDGQGRVEASTGLPVLDHFLQALGYHALWDLSVTAQGDIQVDPHHTVEDVGLVMGEAIRDAVGSGAGIARFGSALLPMDDALCLVAVDVSGRPFLAWEGAFPPAPVGGVQGEVWPEFFRALASRAGLTLHVRLLAGVNAHHAVEAAFKGVGRALRAALARDPGREGAPSTKGALYT